MRFKTTSKGSVSFMVYTFKLSGMGVMGECEIEALESHGYHPNGIYKDKGTDSDTTVPEENQEPDATADLPPVIVSEEWRKDGPPPRGSGWLGIGAPIKVHHNYRTRTFEDGGGICSPGRWRPGYRNLPDIGEVGVELIKAMGIDMKTWDKTICQMLAGHMETSPFTVDQSKAGNAFMREWCKQQGFPAEVKPGDVHHEHEYIDLRLLQAFLRICEDPDAPALDAYCSGVRLGHNMQMPRTPAVYEEKRKWRLSYESPDAPTVEWATNYKTAKERQSTLVRKIKEDVTSGRMVRTTYGKAKAEYKERLHIGALGLVEEGDDNFRLIHDGTHLILVNNKMRVRDQQPSPMIQDVAAEAQEQEESGLKHMAIVWDYKSAHRIVDVAQEDWGLQGCATDSIIAGKPADDAEIFLNTVGTFGFSTAGYWWNRLGAMVSRGSHYILTHKYEGWILLFADDGKATFPAEIFKMAMLILFAFMAAMKIPIKWQKVKGGWEFQWIGYWIDLTLHRVGVSKKRITWMIGWIEAVLDGKVPLADFDSGLGRLSFICGALAYDRPFLAPLYSLAAAVRSKTGRKVDTTNLPPYIKFIFLHLLARFRKRSTIHCMRGRPCPNKSPERFRTDAKAEGELVTVGGYETFDGKGWCIDHKKARWFLLKLDRTNAPWAFSKGEPFRAIAALEMLGSLLGIMLLLDGDNDDACSYGGTMSVGGYTDNIGNRFVLARLLTTKWPLVAFLSEIAAQLEHRKILFEMSWVPREQNAEADAITNGDVGWLSPGMRVATDMKTLPFQILPDMLAQGEAFYMGDDNVNAGTPELNSRERRTLRVRDPWG